MNDLADIFEDCNLKVDRCVSVHGGDINEAYCLFTQSGKYFLKVNDKNKYANMFAKEANGLALLKKNSLLIIPAVIKHSICEERQYLLLEWLDKGSVQNDTWKDLGARLALMHQRSNAYFGLHENNYIGSLEQINDQHHTWSEFYAECRIMPLIKLLFDRNDFSSEDLNDAELFCKRSPDLFPAEPPALLHGDLWGGNFMSTSNGRAAIYDPAVYYGHREMDIGMSKLFGGFDQQFYTAYNEVYSMEKGWEQRLRITQLYPLLVHAVLFGGHYIRQVKNDLKVLRKDHLY